LLLCRETHVIEKAHEDIIRDIDYNPNKPYHVVTAGVASSFLHARVACGSERRVAVCLHASGEDRRVRVWDLRKPQKPLKILGGHTHWCGFFSLGSRS
jgi:WD40 repeat protein